VAALWQLQGLLEWLHLVLAPYHELVARLIAKEHTHCCELLGNELSILLSHFQKINSMGYGNFQTYGSLH
jgi:hypothetical protein